MRKQGFCKCENKGTDQLRGNYVFVTRIVQSLYPKFQAYSHLLWLRSPVCVGPGRKPQKPFIAQRGSYKNGNFEDLKTKGVDQMCCYPAAEQCLWYVSINSIIRLLDKS